MRALSHRFGFTLVEVNLAIGIMAAGVLSMCGLYALGYRENIQSEDDVVSTAYADACIAPIVAALSSPQLTWDDWLKIGASGSGSSQNKVNSNVDALLPENGWDDYVDVIKNSVDEYEFKVVKNPNAIANGVIGKLSSVFSASKISVSPTFPSEYYYALVITRSGSVVQIAFRMGRRREQLMNQPIYVTEVMFQGGWGKTE